MLSSRAVFCEERVIFDFKALITRSLQGKPQKSSFVRATTQRSRGLPMVKTSAIFPPSLVIFTLTKKGALRLPNSLDKRMVGRDGFEPT